MWGVISFWYNCTFSNNNSSSSEYLFSVYLSGKKSIRGLCLFFRWGCLLLRYSLSILILSPLPDAWLLNIFCRLTVVLVSDGRLDSAIWLFKVEGGASSQLVRKQPPGLCEETKEAWASSAGSEFGEVECVNQVWANHFRSKKEQPSCNLHGEGTL